MCTLTRAKERGKMAITLQQIAEQAGVSRGTVDRALNNRGRIKPEVAEKIKRIAREMGYQPNRAGRAMSMAGKGLKIGVIVQSADTPFIQGVLEGVEQARNEVESLGGTVRIYQIEGMDAGEVIRKMELLRSEQFNAIALMPSDDQLLRQTINTYIEEYQIPIVTFNGDLEDTKRLCFVGQDGVRSGKAAAGLLGEITGSTGKVCLISGNEHNRGLNDRIKGFAEEIKLQYPEIEILGPRYIYDDNWVAERVMEELLDQHPDIRGVYIVGHGERGVCDCLKKKKMDHKIKVVANDILKDNIPYLEDGSINFLIGQDPLAQGFEPTMILHHLLFDGIAPQEELQYTDIVIKTKYNV